MKTARIDADLCCFAVASACEGKRYDYKGEIFDSKVLLNKILKEDGVDDNSVRFFTDPEPWDKVKTSAISYLEDIISKVDMDYEVYLSGKGNFRYSIATIQPYKANRISIQRPVHLDAIRQLYTDLYGAIMSVGMEADDLIGLEHDIDSDLIVTRDKDLNCIPGRHYDWIKEEFEDIALVDADRQFYKQVLIGDPTDNIPGLYGVGKDSKLVKSIMELEDDRLMFDYVKDQYECRFGSYWRMFMKENCQLLWIKQQRTATWENYIATPEIIQR